MRSALKLLLSLSLLFPGAASAQSFEQIGFLRLNDTTPRSTRSLSLGGAADPLGDDDMVANPATIASVARPRFIVQGARNSVTVTKYDVTQNNVMRNQAWVTSSGLSQIAALIPLRPGLTVGAYYASEPQLRGLDPLVTSFGMAAYAPPACPTVCAFGLPVANASFERRDRRAGVALGWQRGAISLGVGADLQQIHERIEAGRALLALSVPSATPLNDRLFRRIDDRSLVPNAGIRWRVTPRVALAAAYNGGGSFKRTTSACNVSGFEFGSCASAVELIGTSTVRMPDAMRAGVAFAATDRLRMIGEAVRRNYSSLALDRYTVFGGEFRFPYRDVTELHAGAEYRLASLPVALRAGWWRDPTRYLQQFAAHETVHHYTVGAGIIFGGARVDLAYDGADTPMQRRALVGVAFGL